MKVITLARKPVETTVVESVRQVGAGAIAVDQSRISAEPREIHNYKCVGAQGCMSLPGTARKHSGEVATTRVETAGRWPANLILQHLDGCRPSGEAVVKGYTINRWKDGAKPFGGGAGHPYEGDAQPDETIVTWDCEENCAVISFDEQSGVSQSPRTYKRKVAGGNKTAYGPGIGESAGKDSLNYGDSRTASRFFKQVKP